MRRHHLGLFAAMLSVSACSSDSSMAWMNPMTWGGGSEASSGAATTPSYGAYGATMGQTSLSAAEHAFIIAAAQGNMGEIQASQLAEQRTTSQSVRQFAQRMVKDHTQANQELTQIASRYGITPPSTPGPAEQAAYQTLQQLSGAAFDRQYLDQQYGAHVTQHAMYETAADRAQAPDLRAYAQRTAPIIQQHIDQLRSMRPAAVSGL